MLTGAPSWLEEVRCRVSTEGREPMGLEDVEERKLAVKINTYVLA